MAGLQTLDPKNPEALHDIGQNKGMQVSEKFVNPGTPDAPLVNREQMTQATIKGNGADILKANLIK
ncbi:hypothetical protein BS162P1_00020 [Bacteroides phage BS162P1]|jgi:hypothetical protein|nr:MAG: hypothetical protein [Bacteriophage sp.]WAX08799.1 hypothetical protein BS162P1_00020 [Bacteroides phage BS162P1]DAV31064.1 MAG TPA: hypothetical protein [Caudoviricetes sp.]